ncbi:MAG TPA: HAD family hydrolase [Nocardioidaceae bacterium]|nr:HAD family hydrolase [Nocardioidaceae bacterium]
MASAIEAVIFDWGGTLTPWKSIDPSEEWASLARMAAPERVEEATTALLDAAAMVWKRSRDEHRSATMAEICSLAGVGFDDTHLTSYREFWEHATYTDEDVLPLFSRLKVDGIKVGVLSNTVWPRAWHEEFFDRDGILDMLDGAVYTSEIPWTKPSPEAFRAAMEAVGAHDPARCVFVGDRLFDDIWGASNVGMRTIHVPHSEIPVDQHGPAKGEPDAVAHRLSEVFDIISAWR